MNSILLSSVTIEQFKSIVNESFEQVFTNLSNIERVSIGVNNQAKPKYIYSIQGLADFLHCSLTTAMALKKKGNIPFKPAPHSRKLIFIESEILEAMAAKEINHLAETSKIVKG